MADFEVDWGKINIVTNFEEMVATLIFLTDLHSVDLIRSVPRNDLFWATWGTSAGGEQTYRAIFEGPGRSDDQRNSSLERKFDEKVATVWKHGKAECVVVLYLNFDDPPPHWRADHKHLTIKTATDIASTIRDNGWWPIFHKYFDGGMRTEDAEKCGFLQPFVDSLIPAVEALSTKESLNLLSWVEHIAFYRPKEMLAFSQALYQSKKITQSDKHPIFGTVTLGRNDYLNKLADMLHPIASHIEYFEAAFELLLRISIEEEVTPHPMRGSLTQSIQRMAGYCYGRDFTVHENGTFYDPAFNQKALNVVARLLKPQESRQLALRCLAVLPKLLEMKVSTSEWLDNRSAVTWREYRLPLSDERLKAIRRGAHNLIFSTFEAASDSELKHRCLLTLLDAFHHMSLSSALQDEFAATLDFLKRHEKDDAPVVLNDILDLLAILVRVKEGPINSEAAALQRRLQENFELRLYYLLFGKKGWEPTEEDLQTAVRGSYDRWSNDPKQLLFLIDGFHAIADSHPTGLRSFLQSLGFYQTEFASKAVSLVSADPSFRSSLSPRFIQSLGYLLCGIRLRDSAQWTKAVEALTSETDKSALIVVLTGLHLHDYTDFVADDLKLVERLVSTADEDIRILGAETLWYFHKYRDFTAVLRVYEQLAKDMAEPLAEAVLRGVALDSREDTVSESWDPPERRAILKRILFSAARFHRLDWDSMANYYLELLLRVLWHYSTDDLLEFFQTRLATERLKEDGYDPLPYDLSILFQDVSDDKQNEFVTHVLKWDTELYGIYWIARLIGLACSRGIQPQTLATVQDVVRIADGDRLILTASILDHIPLSEAFYEIALTIVERGSANKDVMSQLYASFLSKTGGGRSFGQPFPSHVQHKELIAKYRQSNRKSDPVQEFLVRWEAEIDGLMHRDEEEDAER